MPAWSVAPCGAVNVSQPAAKLEGAVRVYTAWSPVGRPLSSAAQMAAEKLSALREPMSTDVRR